MIVAYIYPANSVIGGPIEARNVVKISGNKVIYDKPDQYGFHGCKIENAYLSENLAQLDRELDLQNEDLLN